MEIDLVYTWVNSQDPLLQARRRRYAEEELKEDLSYNGEVRYRDHGELAYSIQSAKRYLPFIRNIYVAHAGSPPSWLAPAPGVVLINQDDLLPPGRGPTFQSDVIEAYLHKIPGLSEHYLYSNDDFFFSRRHDPSDFFSDQGHCLIAVTDRFAGMGFTDGPFKSSEANSARVLKRHLALPKNIPVGSSRISLTLNHPRSRFRAALDKLPLLNVSTHVTQSYRKSYWRQFHEVFAEEIATLASRRFRSRHGLAVNLMYHHYLRSIDLAHFYYEPRHAFLDRRDSPQARERLRQALLSPSQEISRFCLNDGASEGNDGWGTFIHSLMNSLGYLSVHSDTDLGSAAHISTNVMGI